MRVGYDVDEVLYPFNQVVIDWHATAYGMPREQLPYPTSWLYAESWGLTGKQWVENCHEAVRAGYLYVHGEPLPAAAESVRAVHAAGHEVHIVTHRFFGGLALAEPLTRWWLRKHGIPFDSLTFSGDKTVVPVDTFAEDNLENYDALAAAGHRPYLIDRPYNRVPDCARRRITDLAAFTESILTLPAAA